MNYHDILNIKYSFKYSIIIFIVLVIVLLAILCNNKITNVYNTVGYVSNNLVSINIPLDNMDTINTLEYIDINNEHYYLDDMEISSLLFDEINYVNYQNINIKLKENIKDNLVIPIKIYYKKEKVLTKIKELLV